MFRFAASVALLSRSYLSRQQRRQGNMALPKKPRPCFKEQLLL